MEKDRASIYELPEQVKTELETAICQGKQRHVETLLSCHKELASQSEAVVELIYFEYVLRQEAGQSPTPEEYLQRFPEYEERLRRLFAFEDIIDQGIYQEDTVADSFDSVEAFFLRGESRANRQRIVSQFTGLVVGNFQCEEIIGRGGMGVVYRATQLNLRRTVAVKILSSLEQTDPTSLSRFLAEARLCGMLNHHGIVQIYETGFSSGIPYIAMEYRSGGTLQDVLRDGPLAPLIAAKVVHEIAAAIAFAHDHSIIHRDLKPGNILLAPDTSGRGIQLRKGQTPVELKVADFGLAKSLAEQSMKTHSEVPVGTPSYMAPEQIGSSQSVDRRSDIYSLGALLFHLLTGKPPFQAASALETLKLVQEEEPVPVRALQPTVPRDLETVCMKCLEKNRERRYVDMVQLATDLQQFIESKPIYARRANLLERSIRWVKRKPVAASLLLTLVLAVLFNTMMWLRAESFRHSAQLATQNANAASDQALTTLRKLSENVVLQKFASQNKLSEQDREYLQEIAQLYSDLAERALEGNEAKRVRAEGYYWSGVANSYLAQPDISVIHFESAINILLEIEASEFREDVFLLANDCMEKLVETLEYANRTDEAIALALIRINRSENVPIGLSNAALDICFKTRVAGYRQLGHLYDMRGDKSNALASWMKALALLEEADISPDKPALWAYYSGVLRSLAVAESEPAKRIDFISRSIEVARTNLQRSPEESPLKRNLAWSLFDYADICFEQNESEKAIAPINEAIKIGEQLVVDSPLLDEYRGPLAIFLRLHGDILASLSRFEEAEKEYERSIELLHRNLKSSPKSYGLHLQLARCTIGLLQVHSQAGVGEETIRDSLDRARAAVEGLRANNETGGPAIKNLGKLEAILDSFVQ